MGGGVGLSRLNTQPQNDEDEEIEEKGPFTRRRKSSLSSASAPSPAKGRGSTKNSVALLWSVIEGAHAGEEFELNLSSKFNSIGRGDDVDICLPDDEYISENHAFVRAGWGNETIEVKDNP